MSVNSSLATRAIPWVRRLCDVSDVSLWRLSPLGFRAVDVVLPIARAARRFAILSGQAKGLLDAIHMDPDSRFIPVLVRINRGADIYTADWIEMITDRNGSEPIDVARLARDPFALIVLAPV